MDYATTRESALTMMQARMSVLDGVGLKQGDIGTIQALTNEINGLRRLSGRSRSPSKARSRE
jgi:hypothetical protein